MPSPILTLLALTGLAACPADGSPAGHPSVVDVDLEALYRSGVTFDDFYASVDQRKALWSAHVTNGSVEPELVNRLSALPGSWHVLAIAEDWCSDSVNTIPFLALLVERVANVELRVIDSEVGREAMRGRRSPDGRPATPTVIVMNETFEEVGCWVERPVELQKWALGDGARLDGQTFVTQKMAWYREDGGRSTVREIVEILEAAATGTSGCTAG